MKTTALINGEWTRVAPTELSRKVKPVLFHLAKINGSIVRVGEYCAVHFGPGSQVVRNT